MRNSSRILVGKPEEKRTAGRIILKLFKNFGFCKRQEIFFQLSNSQLLKKDFSPCLFVCLFVR
jgi:hypothetical protein